MLETNTDIYKFVGKYSYCRLTFYTEFYEDIYIYT